MMDELLKTILMVENPLLQSILLFFLIGSQVYIFVTQRLLKKNTMRIENMIAEKAKDIIAINDIYRAKISAQEKDLMNRQLSFAELKLELFVNDYASKYFSDLKRFEKCRECILNMKIIDWAFDRYWREHIRLALDSIKSLIKLWIPLNEPTPLKIETAEDVAGMIADKIYNFQSISNFKEAFGVDLISIIPKQSLKSELKDIVYKTSEMFNDEFPNRLDVIKSFERQIREALK
jgi:hypothetical protein